MEFRTIVNTRNCSGSFDHGSRLLFIGSCFSDEIAGRLQQRLFDVMANPYGTLYNPASILLALERAAMLKEFSPDDLFFHNDLYHSPLCHSSLSSARSDEMVSRLNEITCAFHKRIKSADAVFLTFGTAWVFEDKQTGEVVANCHKLPADRFIHRMMDTEECARIIRKCVSIIHGLSPDASVYLTVSPIRHLANGAHGNQLSKATLLLAVDNVVKNNAGVQYFPSYEMLLDDLRDYRFYTKDMCHPSEQAADYIYELFSATFFPPETIALSSRCLKLTRRMSHRQITGNQTAYDNFVRETDSIMQKLLNDYPCLKNSIQQFKKS